MASNSEYVGVGFAHPVTRFLRVTQDILERPPMHHLSRQNHRPTELVDHLRNRKVAGKRRSTDEFAHPAAALGFTSVVAFVVEFPSEHSE